MLLFELMWLCSFLVHLQFVVKLSQFPLPYFQQLLFAFQLVPILGCNLPQPVQLLRWLRPPLLLRNQQYLAFRPILPPKSSRWRLPWIAHQPDWNDLLRCSLVPVLPKWRKRMHCLFQLQQRFRSGTPRSSKISLISARHRCLAC